LRQTDIIPAHMFLTYLKSAFRSLSKNRTFAILNITGLSIGLTCSLLIALYVMDELSYDKYNVGADRIYRIDEEIKFGGFNYDGTQVSAAMGPTIAKDFPQIEHYTRLQGSSITVHKGVENVNESKVAYADSSLFDVFTLPLIAGDKETALKEPHSLVISESMARKYFNSLDVLGKTLLINDSATYKITGLIKDMPGQANFHFDFFMPLSEKGESRGTSWFQNNFWTFVLFKPGTDVPRFEQQLNKAMVQYQAATFKTVLNSTQAAFEKAGNTIRVSLMPITAIHLHSHKQYEMGVNGSIQYVYIFSAIAIFILLIACINFMNLSTARSANRAKEVGVRKVLGSLRNNLIAQFLSESFVACCLSFLVAIVLAILLLPLFNTLADKQIPQSVFLSTPVWLGTIGLFVFVSLVSGSYPAFFLSSFQPIKVLKGNLAAGFKGSSLRNTLVVLQFSISVVLMIGTLVIYNQLQYIRNKDLGFNKEQVLVLQNTDALGGKAGAFKNELLQIPGVQQITSSPYMPMTGFRNSQGYTTVPQFDGKNFTLMQTWGVDEAYIPTLQMKLLHGRNFSDQFPTDSTAVVVNEAAAKLLGNASPLDKHLYRIDNLSTKSLTAFHVVGVVKDFNYNSLREEVTPIVLYLHPDNEGMALRIRTQDIPGLLKAIKLSWTSLQATQPLSYTFLDDAFNEQYKEDQRRGEIFLIFSILAIFIACLGLFGLVTFAAEQRSREIGIRKVLGAAVSDIFTMLSKDFVKLLLLSIVIASPIAWWAMNHWLQDFAYRISIGWWMFVLVGAVCLLIALGTISFQTIKAAVANPVKSLRSE
jgi:putative ABC transport system permease protein